MIPSRRIFRRAKASWSSGMSSQSGCSSLLTAPAPWLNQVHHGTPRAYIPTTGMDRFPATLPRRTRNIHLNSYSTGTCSVRGTKARMDKACQPFIKVNYVLFRNVTIVLPAGWKGATSDHYSLPMGGSDDSNSFRITPVRLVQQRFTIPIPWN